MNKDKNKESKCKYCRMTFSNSKKSLEKKECSQCGAPIEKLEKSKN